MNAPKQVREGFEAFYGKKWSGHEGFWLDWYPPHLGLYADVLRDRNAEIEKVVAERAPIGRALDVGCGVGDVSRILARYARTLISSDVVNVNVERTRANLRRLGHPALVLLAGGEGLPFGDASLDLATLGDVIEHIPDRAAAVRELARVLRPGGLLVIVTPDKNVLEAIERVDARVLAVLQGARRAVKRVLGRGAVPPPADRAAQEDAWEEFLTRGEIGALVEASGFRVIEHRNICFYPGPEGGGAFAWLLGILRGHDRVRERVEPLVRRVFQRIASLEKLNQKQLVVAERV